MEIRYMTANRKLWEKLEKMPGGDKNPFEIPLGPTDECLSATQVVSLVKDSKSDPKILRHLESCESCRENIDRFKKVYP